MSEPTVYRCIKTVTVTGTKGQYQAFAKDKDYRALPWYEEDEGDVRQAGVSFRNDRGDLHFAPFGWLNEHFVKVDSAV